MRSQSLEAHGSGHPPNESAVGLCLVGRKTAYKILGPLGAQWFYEGESLGYRTLYVWIADQDLMITVQTNSQPPDGTDNLHEAVSALYEIVKKPKAD